jgi:hypothetical protein
MSKEKKTLIQTKNITRKQQQRSGRRWTAQHGGRWMDAKRIGQNCWFGRRTPTNKRKNQNERGSVRAGCRNEKGRGGGSKFALSSPPLKSVFWEVKSRADLIGCRWTKKCIGNVSVISLVVFLTAKFDWWSILSAWVFDKKKW